MSELPFRLGLTVLLAACATHDSEPLSLSRAELLPAVGTDWVGTLTYRDYSAPDVQRTLRVEVAVAADEAGLRLALHYPNEPHADGVETLALAADGRSFAGAPIVARERDGDTLEIVTRGPGEDDGRPATVEHVYRFGPRELQVRKVVQIDGQEPFVRNEYRFRR